MIQMERVHASELDDVYRLLLDEPYDVIHFSAHGGTDGIILDKSGLAAGGEAVTAERLRAGLALAERAPLLCLFLCCFSEVHLPVLAQTAPYVITSVGAVSDSAALSFVKAFYERFFQGHAIASAFDAAVIVAQSQGADASVFRLHRRQLVRKGASKYVECTPSPRYNNSILVNLDAVWQHIPLLGMSEEQLTYLIEKKLRIHYWIFAIPRDRCIIPIGRLLFGEFSWKDANDVVLCTRLLKLSSTTPDAQWRVWSRLLVSYNDLASLPYRAVDAPSSPTNRRLLNEAAQRFQQHAARFLRPELPTIRELGFTDLIPNAEFFLAHVDNALDEIKLERLEHVVKELEQALTNYHEIVDGLQPAEETTQNAKP
ncbi:MAG: hypothetical protein FLDDKLPJ_03052 [Phycisphaerae bacterium]|nr:hypothetical protein [Phycisphaerae bacterium]